jgi:integrase
MGIKIKDTKLGTREARRELKQQNNPHWRQISQGLHVGYRKGAKKRAWLVRLFNDADGKYVWRTLGEVDDILTADGTKVLNWAQAQDKAQDFDKEVKQSKGIISKPLTVKEASENYLTWFKENKKGLAMAESAINAHILPTFGETKLSDLTTKAIETWLAKVASTPARLRTGKFAKKINRRAAPKTDEDKKSRKSSANRILTVLKAMLNKAYKDGNINSNAAWSKVEPFESVDQARIRYLTDAEAQRLVNACPADLRALVRAALLTGARRGELAALTARDVNLTTAQIYIAESKSGKPRHVPLNPEGLAHFRETLTGKTGDQLVFTREDGTAWGHNYHVRALTVACEAAKVIPMVSFHELRHTYASHLANAGVDLLTISKLLGHSDTRITAKHYAHLADKTLAMAVTKLPSFEMSTKDGLRAVA